MAIEVKYRWTEMVGGELADRADLPIGNFGDWKKLVIQLRVFADFYTRRDGGISVVQEDGLVKFIIDSGEEWKDFGIFTLSGVGNGIEITLNNITQGTVTPNVVCSIANCEVQGSVMSFAEADLTMTSVTATRYPYSITNSSGIETVSQIVFKAYRNSQPLDIDELVFNMSLIDNDLLDSDNVNSFIDSSRTGFRAKGLLSLNQYDTADFIPIGNQSGMAIKQATFIKDAANNYSIYITYMIHGLVQSYNKFKSGDPPQYLEDQNSITENFTIEAWPNANDINVKIPLIDKEKIKGNVGWINENFNGQDSHALIEGLIIKDVFGNVYDSVPYNIETVLSFTLKNTNGGSDWVNRERLGFGIMHIPTDSRDYSNKTTSFLNNFYVNSLNKQLNVQGENGFIPDYGTTTTYQGHGLEGRRIDVTPIQYNLPNGVLKIEVTITPNAAFTAFMESKDEDDRLCYMWIASQGTGDLADSDRSTNTLVLDSFEKALPIIGEYDNITARFLNHAETSTLSGDKVVHTKPNDDLSGKIQLWLPNASVFRMTGITYAIEMIKNDGHYFKLDSKFLDTSQSVILDDGTQQINVTQYRGFKLADTNEKNKVSIIRDMELDAGDLNGYKGVFGWKNRWEYWLKVTGDDVNNDFFDETQMHNGYNHQWERYVKNPEWDIYFVTYIHGTEPDGNEIIYRNPHKFFIGDYDDNPNITTQFFFKNAETSETLVGGSDTEFGSEKNLGIILSVERTHFEIQYTLGTGVWTQGILDLLYATATIEVNEGSGFLNMRQISTVNVQESGNPMVPLNLQFLKWEIDGTNPKVLKVTFLINPAELDIGSSYRFTGRLGCKDAIITGQYNNQYNEQYD